jgi:4-diphosphocytidyl-2-C-methyl-D-erythritol kinase
MAAETALARAKINLSLHVTGQRADGYHLLDSLVVFADLGDVITVAPAPDLSLRVIGPMAEGLTAGADNLVLRAAQAFQTPKGAAITLDKHLPLASGIGGGSADAAATLTALSRLWKTVQALGADVAVCLLGRTTRMQGIGDILTPFTSPLPPTHLVLVNPGVALTTPSVFRALTRRDNAPLPKDLPRLHSVQELAAFLLMQRNDLEAPALRLAPETAMVKQALGAQHGCLLARMSGSGATCFGLFADPLTAAAAAAALGRANPDWWVRAAPMLP